MNEKAIRRAGCVAGVIVISGLLAASAFAQARPAGAAPSESAQIVSAVESLADQPAGVTKIFAKRLADVLAKNKVAIGMKLSALELTPNSVAPKDEDLAKIHQTVGRIMELARGGKALPIAGRTELIETIAKHCPSSAASMEAAVELARIVEGGLSGLSEMAAGPEAAAGAIREALYKCFDHVHCAWINDDDVRALKLVAEQNLMGALAYLLACTGEKPDADATQKAMEEVNRRVNEGAAPREADNAPGADDTLKIILTQLDGIVKATPAIAGMATERKDVSLLLQKFLSAVNKEDRKTALACATPAMAAALEKLPSLRSAIGGGADVEKIDFIAIAAFGAPPAPAASSAPAAGSQPAIAAAGAKRTVDAQVIVVGRAGAGKPRVARLSLERAADGWKIATP